MVQMWPRSRLYAFPLIALLSGVLARVRRYSVSLLLVALYWAGRPKYGSRTLKVLESPPWQVPIRRDLLSQAGGTIFYPRPELWRLWVWPLWEI